MKVWIQHDNGRLIQVWAHRDDAPQDAVEVEWDDMAEILDPEDWVLENGMMVFRQPPYKRIAELKDNLADTDWAMSQLFEGFYELLGDGTLGITAWFVALLKWRIETRKKFAGIVAQRIAWRKEIEELGGE